MSGIPELTVRRGDSLRIVELIDRINLKTQSQPLTDKLQSQFDYVKGLVERLRREAIERKQSQESTSETRELTSIDELISQNYTNEPIRASTISKLVRSITGKRYTRTNLEDDLKASTRFRLKTSHNVAYVVAV